MAHSWRLHAWSFVYTKRRLVYGFVRLQYFLVLTLHFLDRGLVKETMGRGRGKGRGGGGEREDQYGGGFGSQDREEHFSAGRGGRSGSGGSFTGGGEAGGLFIDTRKDLKASSQ